MVEFYVCANPLSICFIISGLQRKCKRIVLVRKWRERFIPLCMQHHRPFFLLWQLSSGKEHSCCSLAMHTLQVWQPIGRSWFLKEAVNFHLVYLNGNRQISFRPSTQHAVWRKMWCRLIFLIYTKNPIFLMAHDPF